MTLTTASADTQYANTKQDTLKSLNHVLRLGLEFCL